MTPGESQFLDSDIFSTDVYWVTHAFGPDGAENGMNLSPFRLPFRHPALETLTTAITLEFEQRDLAVKGIQKFNLA